MKIGEVSKLLNVPASAIRYYEDRGLIQSQRSDNGYRDYDEFAVNILELILFAKDLGFTLNEISFFAKQLRSGKLEKQKVNAAISAKTEELNQKIKRFRQFQKKLAEVMNSKCRFDFIYKK